MDDKSATGLWIPDEVLKLPISIPQKFLLAEIIILSQNGKGCFASNQYLADFMGLGVNSVQKHIAALKSAGYITVLHGTQRYIVADESFSRGVKNYMGGVKNYTPGCKNLHGGDVKNYMGGCKNLHEGVENFTPIEYRENIDQSIGENIARTSSSDDGGGEGVQPTEPVISKMNSDKPAEGDDASVILGEPEDNGCIDANGAREDAVRYAQVRWQSIQGTDINSYQAEFLAGFILKFGKEWFEKAVGEVMLRGNAVKGNKFSYLRKVMERWEESGLEKPWEKPRRADKAKADDAGSGISDAGFGIGYPHYAPPGSKMDTVRQAMEILDMMGGEKSG